jgi:transcriptional regulator with XRE-family HTH domain
MPSKPEQTRRKVIFGRYMHTLREQCEKRWTPDQLAAELQVARTTITRMEGGYTVPGFLLVRTLLEIYKATPDERAEAEQLRSAAKVSTSLLEHAADMPEKYRAFRIDEADAVVERTLDTVIIPAQLQTAEYAADVWRGAGRLTRSAGGEAAAAERQERQELLMRKENPLKLHALIDEVALRRMIGGPTVMSAQLDHLLTVGALPNVTIQVIPFSQGAYGPLSGPMILLSFADPDGPGLAYLEYIARSETVENEEDVALLSAVWDDVAAKAPSPRRSRQIIRAARDAILGHEH